MLTGKQVLLLRLVKGLAQKELADKINVNQQRISVIEKKTRILSKNLSKRVITALQFSEQEAKNIINSLPPPRIKWFIGFKKIISSITYKTNSGFQQRNKDGKKDYGHIIFSFVSPRCILSKLTY